ncbi:hypothetical protein ACLMJK_001025 [Lecanora helva]
MARVKNAAKAKKAFRVKKASKVKKASRLHSRSLKLSWPNTIPMSRKCKLRKVKKVKKTVRREQQDHGGKFFGNISKDPEFDEAMDRYHKAFEGRLRQCRKWVAKAFAERRFDAGVRNELNAYWGKSKYGDQPAAKTLSEYASQAVGLMERDIGTDWDWAKGFASILSPFCPSFERQVEHGAANYHIRGIGYVGEEDLESWVDDEEEWDDDVEIIADDNSGKKVVHFAAETVIWQ